MIAQRDTKVPSRTVGCSISGSSHTNQEDQDKPEGVRTLSFFFPSSAKGALREAPNDDEYDENYSEIILSTTLVLVTVVSLVFMSS